ncbi:MAG: hypothetical protein BAJALOKI1v1_1540002 [Promethearchaeota archaeon]|nr:MAG: hypothetical protein BAJALOKI1v1_1540002 [Candidatus Lokiarchaeota archaeon]
MVPNNNPNDSSIDDFDLICDLCQSTEIIETSQGYVCSNCGFVLELPRMKYNRPYEKDRIHHAIPSGTTKIGSQKERICNKHSPKLTRLNKIQKTNTSSDYCVINAEVELSRLLTGLSLSSSLKEPLLRVFKDIRKKLSKGTKYRNPEKLLPTLLYFYCKQENIAVNEVKLLNIAKIEKKDYDYCKLKISSLMPHYYERNRKGLILTKILGLTEGKKLGMAFYYDAKKILMKLWKGIKCTTDDVVAGLVSSIAALCHYQEKITVSSICKALNIQMSTIQSQVKRKLIDRFNVMGFKSLVASANLIKSIIYHLGVFSGQEGQEEVPEKVLEVDLIKAVKKQKNNSPQDVKCEETTEKISEKAYTPLKKEENTPQEFVFSFIIPPANNSSRPVYVIIRLDSIAYNNYTKGKQEKFESNLKIQDIRYYYPTGPPPIASAKS